MQHRPPINPRLDSLPYIHASLSPYPRRLGRENEALVGLLARVSPSARLRDAIERAKGGALADVFPILARAAERGSAEAQYWVGRAYADGKGVPPSRSTAALWLERAAEAGSVDAQSVLAGLYLTGAGRADGITPGSPLFSDVDRGEPDFQRALHWARKAAESGDAEAQAVVGYILTSGPDHLRDLPAAEEWYRKSSVAGCPRGALGYGLALMRSAGDEERQRNAAKADAFEPEMNSTPK